MRQKQRVFSLFLLSPSSRRAWIEIYGALNSEEFQKVALLAEGVDRNLRRRTSSARPLQSPSSRRAWIEISDLKPCVFDGLVALLAEGVDRNPVSR